MTERRSRPQRSCLGCRQTLDQDQLVRLVRAPDGTILVDERHRLPGRGAYVCQNRQCLEQALRKRQFDRAFRSACKVAAADELLAAMRTALRGRMASLLGMARKSSQCVGGSNAVLDALDHPGRLALVLMSEDISPGIAEKVERKAAFRQVTLVRLFTKAELGSLLGRAERSVLGLTEGQLTETFRNVWDRYQAILGES